MIYEKIAEIMKELSTQEKIKREDITKVMQPLFAKYMLVLRPVEVVDYKFENQEASFKIKYELVDAEEKNNLQSIFLEVPGGGYDQEGKGRSTYMASTGAYRQAIQQLFAIQIEDELSQINSGFTSDENAPTFHEFQDSDKTDGKENTGNVIDIRNNTNFTEQKQEKNDNTVSNMDEITDEEIDREFAEF